MRLLREPLVQFLALAALIFLIYPFSKEANRQKASERVVVDAATQRWMFDNFEKQFHRRPMRSEMEGMVATHVDSEIKYREAVAMGLDEGDSIVQRRLVQKFDFLFGDAGGEVQPDESSLREWYEQHGEQFARPGTLSFTHLWFSSDSRANAASDAQLALIRLSEGETAQADPFPFQSSFSEATPGEVRNVFGLDFTESIFQAPLNKWIGPLQSGLGIHLANVSSKTLAERPEFEAVRDRVLDQWREQESKRVLAAFVEKLHEKYEIEIDQASLDGLEYAP